jgi:hypothetical protein
MIVEVLTFAGCPHGEPALELARAGVAAAGVDAEVRRVSVTQAQTDEARFLGSPSIRVDGSDVEPGADRRTDYTHGCRLYRTARGPSTLPDGAWIHDRLVGVVNRG